MRAPRLALFVTATVTCVTAQEPAPPKAATPQPTPADATVARSRALELAGAFANDGYKVRDGFFSGALEKGKPVFLQVNLFSGNEYWFSAAANGPARKISVDVFDAKGRPLEGETYKDAGTAAAGIVTKKSGPHVVRVELTDGDKSDFCLVYSYK